MRTCTACLQDLPEEDFRRRPNGRREASCRTCDRAKSKKWRADNPERHRELRVLHNLKKFGLTPAQYDEMHTAQSGLCAICHLPQLEKGRSLCVDHDHETGVVRGLLCGPCNRALGLFKDDARLVEKAAEYLRTAK